MKNFKVAKILAYFLFSDCEYNNKTYYNGEKIDTPDTPCRVCYCKGGEVMCSTVGCYERDDCEGKMVPGTCCLKYDHCPPLGMLFKNDFSFIFWQDVPHNVSVL